MILMTENAQGKFVFVNPDTSTSCPSGRRALSAGDDLVANGLQIS
jgi:hypothetical protein